MSIDDTQGPYLKVRQDANPSPAQQFRASQAPATTPPAVSSSFSLLPVIDKVGDVLGDIGAGIVEAPRQIVGGAMDAGQEILEAADSLGGAIENFIGAENIPTILQFRNEQGEIDFDLLSRSEVAQKGGLNRLMPDVDEPRSVTGSLIRGVSQFVTGFIPAAKALAPLKGGAIVKAAGAGAIADAIVFDPHEDRLSNLIESQPALANPVTQFLAAKPEDSEAAGRFKNALEGLGLGMATEAMFAAVRGIKASRIQKLEQEATAVEKAQIDAIAGDAPEEVAGDVPTQMTGDVPDAMTGDVPTEGNGVNMGEVNVGEPVDATKPAEPEAPKQLPIKDESIEGEFIPFEEKIAPKDAPAFGMGEKKADGSRALNINLNRLDTTDDIKATIEGIGKMNADKINEARREVITHEQTQRLADDLGMSVDDLMARRSGEAFNAEQAVAARQLLVASGQKLVELAKIARTGGDQEVAAFRRAVAQHTAIQNQVSGLTAEAGRALASFNIKAKSEAQQTRMIREALDAGGGIRNSQRMAEMFATLETPEQIAKMAREAQGAKNMSMIYEAWINGLLSGPQTHAVNVLSNALVSVYSVGERKVANLIGGTLDIENVPRGETSAQAYGAAQGAKEGMRLAWIALKTGEPSDALTKLESVEHKAITGENLGLTGTPGRFADFMGEVIRIPGRLLTTGDEFFKAVGYRMELHAQAFRMAAGEGLDGRAMAQRMQDLIDNPPENIELEAINAMRYQTFTNELGDTGKSFQDTVSKTPGARVIIPFIRTPTNIIKYVGERTPLSPLLPSVREELKAGGARRDMALAKVATGSMIMAGAADFAMSGDITGGGPKDPATKNILRATGWQPYSIRAGNEYHAYNRLDPIGATIGLAADAAEIIGQTSEADAMDIALAAATAVAQNLTSKTYLSGLADFFDVMSSASADPEGENLKMKRWVSRMAGTVIPTSIATVARTEDPILRATDGIFEKWQSRIPGWSESLPPRRNIFGEVIRLEGGIGPDIMSPIYRSTDKNDKVADELVLQQTRISMPRRAIQGVKLSTVQYDQYIKFYSGMEGKLKAKPLRQTLGKLFRSKTYKRATEGSEGAKSMAIRSVFDSYREGAKAQMIATDADLRAKIIELKTKKAVKLGG
jgi:hypothetical protein